MKTSFVCTELFTMIFVLTELFTMIFVLCCTVYKGSRRAPLRATPRAGLDCAPHHADLPAGPRPYRCTAQHSPYCQHCCGTSERGKCKTEGGRAGGGWRGGGVVAGLSDDLESPAIISSAAPRLPPGHQLLTIDIIAGFQQCCAAAQ